MNALHNGKNIKVPVTNFYNNPNHDSGFEGQGALDYLVANVLDISRPNLGSCQLGDNDQNGEEEAINKVFHNLSNCAAAHILTQNGPSSTLNVTNSKAKGFRGKLIDTTAARRNSSSMA